MSVFIVTKRIRYHNPDSELSGQIITPDMPQAKEGLDFSHLDNRALLMLQKKGYLAPLPKAKGKKD
jgi:hypothetical protein